MTNPFLIVGLGNPGTKYAHNRHNIGFMAVDAIAARFGASEWVKKFSGQWSEAQGLGFRIQDSGFREGKKVLKNPESRILNPDPLFSTLHFLKPQTYMNLSGESVAAAARFYKIPPENIIVLHDELDLPDGKLKVKQGGGAGGHNGLKSIDAHLGDNYWRVRIGIGHPGDKAFVSSYVLGDFSKEEWEVQEKMIEVIAQHFSLMISGDAAGFMNKVALALSPISGSPPPLRGRVREGGGATTIQAKARHLRSNMTDAEKKLWYHLRRENLSAHKFRRQQPLGPYIVDFACLEKKLIVEVDGSQHAEQVAQDTVRSAYLAQTGHKVLRFWNNEVLENMDGVLQVILTELESR